LEDLSLKRSDHSGCITFGPFEVNASAGELLKRGIRVRLPGQSFQILLLLLGRPGEVVTREQLRNQIWGEGTFVDFEHGLNVAMNKLRRALADSADHPQYIETMPGRGYRFIGSLQGGSSTEEARLPALPETPLCLAEGVSKPGSKKTWVAVGAMIGGAFVVCLLIWMGLQRPAARRELRVQQLTTNSAENPVWHAVISPDGKYVAYGDLAGIQIRLIGTGESHLLPRPQSLKPGDAWFPSAWLPDGTRILATSITSAAVAAWSVSIIGGAAALLRNNALIQSVSGDGLQITFVTSRYMGSAENAINRRVLWNSEIWTMGPDGEDARRVVSGDNLTYFGSVRWSPDGTRIAYQKFRLRNGSLVDYTIESCDLNGRTPSLIETKRNYTGESIEHNIPEDFCWLADGRVIYAVREPPPNSRDSNLWAVAVDSKRGRPHGQPTRITNLSGFHMEALSVAEEGKKLVFESSSDQSYVYVGRLDSDGRLENVRRLTADQRYNTPYAWTSDSKAVIFRSDRTGSFAIYKQALDEDVAELIPTGPGKPLVPRVSPGGGWLIYPVPLNAGVPDEFRLMRVPLTGGRPQVMLGRTKLENFDCPRRAGAPCVVCETNGNERIFSIIDPASGARHEAFRIVRNTLDNWKLSADGSQIAMVGDSPKGSIDVRLVTGQMKTRIQVKGWPNPYTIDWAVDDKTLFVSHPGLIESPSGPIGTTLLRVDFEGNAQPVWEMRGARYTWAICSPNGKYLAIRGARTERNAWMLENF
jgi:DNA-binding winged helix-turn-helix (wHTH) protein/Tol biopolymer transport system component